MIRHWCRVEVLLRSVVGTLAFFLACGPATKAYSESGKLAVSPVAESSVVGKHADARLRPLKDLNGYFPFAVPDTKEQWAERRESLQRQIRVATGLWPWPVKTELNAVIRGKIARDGFTVEKVHFESVPGHIVTGLLFRPTGAEGRRPGVLCPHGHGGRLMDHGPEHIRELIINGEERFERSGRYPKLARYAQLARMGCVVFAFDMLGYADSVQISNELAHKFSKQRPELDSPERWGLFSTQAELRLQSIMGLQTWNSIRALDFLCGLPDVDTKRIGVTGGSGGGTQTILLCAIDPRPAVAFPNGMVSTSMQGGCTCENCSLLRVGTGNVELAALFAPKPLGMTAADDWTVEMMTKGYPELRQLYEMLGAKDNVMCRSLVQFGHNYNYVSRATMYHWFNKHLQLGLKEPIVEEDWEPLSTAEQHVWGADDPAPTVPADYEPKLLAKLAEQSDKQIDAILPTDHESMAPYRDVVGKAWQTILGRTLGQVGPVAATSVDQKELTLPDGLAYVRYREVVRTRDHGQALPVISLLPGATKNPKQLVIWVDGKGKSSLFGEDGEPRSEVRDLLSKGIAVVGADLLFQKEFLSPESSSTWNRVVDNPREAAAYTFGYNSTLFAQRVHDILALIRWGQTDDRFGAKRVHLVGFNGAGPLVAAAAAVAESGIDHVAIDTEGFRFADLTSYRDQNFVPGALKYRDMPGLLSLIAPGHLWISGETEQDVTLAQSSYHALGHDDRLTIAPKGSAEAACRWLAGQ